MRESASAKALRLLAERRCNILWRDRWQLIADVRGDSGVEHRIRWSSGDGWRCTCAVMRSGACSHVMALQHVIVINRHLGATS